VPETGPNLSELIQRLPRQLQHRFEALGGYVRGVVAEENEQSGGGTRRRKQAAPSAETIQFIQIVAFAYTLKAFLRDGSRAAKSAALAFTTLGYPAFRVGQTEFTIDNEATMRGEKLADALVASLEGTRYEGIVGSARSLRGLVRTLIRETRRE
jgi:hypothetical protein